MQRADCRRFHLVELLEHNGIFGMRRHFVVQAFFHFLCRRVRKRDHQQIFQFYVIFFHQTENPLDHHRCFARAGGCGNVQVLPVRVNDAFLLRRRFKLLFFHTTRPQSFAPKLPRFCPARFAATSPRIRTFFCTDSTRTPLRAGRLPYSRYSCPLRPVP